MAHISTPGTFTLALDADMPSGLIPLATDGLHLTIVGIGGEQRITLNAADRLFDIGASAVRDAPDGSTSLTLGNNITLIGHITGHNNALIRVRDSGRLYMLEGSQIRGHTSTTTSVDSGHGAAVHIAAHGTFTMRGGTITANRASGVTGTNGAGGVFMADADTAGFYMEGGSITGNYRGTGTTAADIFFGQAVNRFTLSGSAAIGNLVLQGSTTGSPIITVGAGTGVVQYLYLRASQANASDVADIWTGRGTLLQAAPNHTLTDTNVAARFPMIRFIGNAEGGQDLNPYYGIVIDESGFGVVGEVD